MFVIATANDVSQLPPELLRKGRFDEIFFVDLPNRDERREILQIQLKKRGRNPAEFDLDALVQATNGYAGSELEEVVVGALYEAFDATQPLATEHLLHACKDVIPLSQTMRERLAEMREWSKSRARRASPPDDAGQATDDASRLEL